MGLGLASLSWRGRLASCPWLMSGGLLLLVLRSWGKSLSRKGVSLPRLTAGERGRRWSSSESELEQLVLGSLEDEQRGRLRLVTGACPCICSTWTGIDSSCSPQANIAPSSPPQDRLPLLNIGDTCAAVKQMTLSTVATRGCALGVGHQGGSRWWEALVHTARLATSCLLSRHNLTLQSLQ